MTFPCDSRAVKRYLRFLRGQFRIIGLFRFPRNIRRLYASPRAGADQLLADERPCIGADQDSRKILALWCALNATYNTGSGKRMLICMTPRASWALYFSPVSQIASSPSPAFMAWL